ncbi:GDSL-type esterase/lipase family protein [uncultured Alistipes sp.]|uniref:GDSL-type esterase/lipase family protein n=1 Tax=uncultured Alistipes sp. TaxID=538949 RepID=UPI003209039C
MKRLLFFILTVGSLFTASDLPAARPVVGFLTNGEGNRIDWAARLPEYDVAEAGEGQFLLSQQHWDLDRRLLNRQPAACILHAGLPEILLGQPLPRILDAFRSVCMRLDTTGIRPVLLLTTPVSAAHPVVNARIRQLNDALRSWAAGQGIVCLDPSERLCKDGALDPACTSDGMMLNAAGQEFLVAEVRDFLRTMDAGGEELPATTRAELSGEVARRILAASPREVRIVLLGDSLTANGGDWNPRLGRHDVRNAGQGGFLTGQMGWLLDTCVLAARPALCFVLGGINDLFNDIPPEVILANQQRIVTRLREAGIQPVVQSVLLVHNNAALNARIRSLNTALTAWCAEQGIDWLDLNRGLTDDLGLKARYTTDGTHLTEEGYGIWSGVLRQYLDTQNLKQTTTPRI